MARPQTMSRVQATNRREIANMPYALQFSGSQRIALDTMGDLGSSFSGALSFGCYIKTTSMLTTAQYIFGSSQSAGGNYAFFGMTRAATRVGKLQLNLRDASGRTLNVEALGRPVNTGDWLHAIFSKDATNTPAGIKIRINAVSQTLTTVANAGYADPVNFDRAMAIGSSLGTAAVAGGWVGGLSRPYFFKRELTQQECDDWFYRHIVPTGAFWGLQNTEGAGTSVADTQGAHNGTLTAASQWITATPYKSRPQRQL